jgi:cell fate (sporulation/competence/biofilm development) regulator YmcA (YheA/YmcA/DUF963 family)
MKYILVFALQFYYFSSIAQSYAVFLIPDSLKKEANAVKRYENIEVELSANGKLTVKRHYVITILNKAADKYAVYNNYYDKMRDLKNIEGILYDAMGKKIKEIKKKDIVDLVSDDGFSLMSDNRIKLHSFVYSEYPYTIEYSDEVVTDDYVNLYDWYPVEDFYNSVQESYFTVTAPSIQDIAYRTLQFNGSLKLNENRLQCALKNFKALPKERFTGDFRTIFPAVYTVPMKFSYGNYRGSLDSWLNYGKFQTDLNKGRNTLPTHTRTTIHQLTDTVKNSYEKVRILYEYLQKTTRYISIQLGIGGLQPFDASFVAEKQYGDCKALSNYMVSLLNEVGIESYYSIIHAGPNEKFYLPDFVSDQTNHIIVCVPFATDTLWLECTSQDMACGFLGSFTDDRYALVIKEDGGHLIKTPKYSASQNIRSYQIEATVDNKGSLSANIRNRNTGLEMEDMYSLLHNYSKKERTDILNTIYDIPTYEIKELSWNHIRSLIPELHINLSMNVPNYCQISGKRLFVKPNLLSRTGFKMDTTSKRMHKIEYPFSFIYYDTVKINIPEGYRPEAVPKSQDITNRFGHYKISFITTDSSITMYREYGRNEGTFPPEYFPEMALFYEKIQKSDNSQVVYVKKE